MSEGKIIKEEGYMKLIKTSKITGVIKCLDNLHIGSSKDIIEIGGMANPVIKHPFSLEPYIPGSSLKGKMRCSLERMQKKRQVRDEKEDKRVEDPRGVCICGNPECSICVVFGCQNNGKSDYPPLGPTRLIVRNSNLIKESIKGLQGYFGEKYENSIDRRTGTAGDPRSIEFVPEGAKFLLNMSLLVYDIDIDKNYPLVIKRALHEVENTYLGGMGSRGYGWVEFQDLKIDGEDFPSDTTEQE